MTFWRETHEMFYNPANGEYTENKEDVPVFRSDTPVFKESWWVNKEERKVIDFHFLGGYRYKDNPYLDEERRMFFKRYKVSPTELRYISLPDYYYDEMKRIFHIGEEKK